MQQAVAEKILTYTVVFEKAREGGYIAYVPLLPGCMTQGETFEETKENVKDAIKGYIEVLKDDHESVPIENEECISIFLKSLVLWYVDKFMLKISKEVYYLEY